MHKLLRTWYERHFSNPEAIMLAFLLVLGFSGVIFFGHMLAPIIASLIIAYLLDGVIALLVRQGALRQSLTQAKTAFDTIPTCVTRCFTA